MTKFRFSYIDLKRIAYKFKLINLHFIIVILYNLINFVKKSSEFSIIIDLIRNSYELLLIIKKSCNIHEFIYILNNLSSFQDIEFKKISSLPLFNSIDDIKKFISKTGFNESQFSYELYFNVKDVRFVLKKSVNMDDFINIINKIKFIDGKLNDIVCWPSDTLKTLKEVLNKGKALSDLSKFMIKFNDFKLFCNKLVFLFLFFGKCISNINDLNIFIKRFKLLGVKDFIDKLKCIKLLKNLNFFSIKLKKDVFKLNRKNFNSYDGGLNFEEMIERRLLCADYDAVYRMEDKYLVNYYRNYVPVIFMSKKGRGVRLFN